MKKPITKALLILSLLVPSLQANEQPNIQVTGVASIKVDADYLEWKLSIRGVADSLQQSQAINEKALKDLLQVLESFAVVKEDRVILQISHGKNTVYDNVLRKRVQRGFYSERDVVFNLRDTSKHAEILSRLVEFKNIEVDRVNFKSSKQISLQQEARLKALLNAKSKASKMAGVLDMKLGSPLKIEEINPQTFHLRSNSIDPFAEDSSPSESYSLDKVSVSGSVKVTFSISPK